MEELHKLCQPIVEYIGENYNPYTEITISMDFVDVRQRIVGIPVKETGDQPED